MKRAASLRVVIATGLAMNMVVANLGPVPVFARPGPQANVVAAATAPVGRPPGIDAVHRMSPFGSQRPPEPKFATRSPRAGGLHIEGPTTVKRPVHPKFAPLDPLAMSAAFRQVRGIPAPHALATMAPPLFPKLQSRMVGPALTTPSGSRASTAVRRLTTVSLTTPSYTGINHYWTYEEDAIPGIGKYMANVGQGGNLIIQADDMAIPHKGIELAFRRTYNSLSQHDYFGSDGSQISNYGAGWTNTFDAHIAFNSGNQNGQGISVYDIDGARYDYLSDGQGHWIPPPGQYATLTCDGTPPNYANCGNGYFWTKKSGTVYYFWKPDLGSSSAALQGRLITIWGRNNSSSLTFGYAFQNADASCSCNLTVITVTEEDGRSAQLQFNDFTVNGQPQRLLSKLIWPNSTAVSYSYDTNGNLAEVDEPPNNTFTTQCQAGLSQCLPQRYGYMSGSLIYWAASPRFVMGAMQGLADWTGTTQYGGYCFFLFDASNALSLAGYAGYMNPTPNDGTNTPIQTAPANLIAYRGAAFAPRTSTSIYWADSDGHQTFYAFDSAGRVTQKQDWNGRVYLTTTQTWDAQNNLIASTDARGNETDYAYDTNGNAIAVAKPSVTNSDGIYRPTSLYSYDPNNNVMAFCDEEFVHTTLHADWTTRPAAIDTLCPQQAGAARMTWAATTAEPFGELTTATKPLGQSISYAYDPGHQGGTDYGQPTYISGATVPATQTITYNSTGDVVTYDKGTGGTWSLTYDTIGRLLTATDADNITSYTTYLPDGAVAKTESAFQHANGMGVLFAYDGDGNVDSETHHHGCAPGVSCATGVTLKWYDGADRLVEVSQPGSWLTRYIYDLSAGGTVSISGGAPFQAFGNLYATREMSWGSGWTDMRGNAYDALDRVTAKFTYKPQCSGVCAEAPSVTTYAFDSSPATLGLLASATDPLSETTTNTYDAAGRHTAVAFSGDGGVTPSRTYSFDGDGRTVSVASSVGTQSYSYDANGRRLTSVQPLGNGTSATMSYGYYDNGLKQNVSVASSTANYTNLIAWAYRGDGLMTLENSMGGSFARTYSPAGRETAFQDPYFTANRTYDATTGLLTSKDIAAGTYSNITHDYEGSVTGYSAYGGQTVTSGLTALGELAAQLYLPGGIDPFSGADTWPTITTSSFTNGHADVDGGIADFRNAVTMMTASNNSSGSCSTDAPSLCSSGLQKTFAFDTAAREASGSMTWGESYSCGGSIGNGQNNPGSPFDNICSHSTTGSFTARHDAENHLLGKTYLSWIYADTQTGLWPPHPGASYTTSYTYGPAGRPIKMAGDSVIWDDDTVLLTLNSSGQVDDIKVGLDADYNATGTTVSVWDRDLGESVTSSHNSTGHDAWIPAHPYRKVSPTPPINAPTASSGFSGTVTAPITAPGSDGYFDGDSVIQGVRAYDPQLGAWTAPDAYAGDVHDPMSQKPYMWNRNNSVDYADPSGYKVSREGWTSAQAEAFDKAIAYLSASPTAMKIINTVINSDQEYKVNFTTGVDDYTSASQTIDWNPHAGLWCDKGSSSPALGLVHELDHASIPKDQLAAGNAKADLTGKNTDAEHVRVTGDENKIADELDRNLGAHEGSNEGNLKDNVKNSTFYAAGPTDTSPSKQP